MKSKTQGFTLIELLIVIAIIGILAAVLIPQLLGARIAANKRAVQAHSSQVYKVVTAIRAEDAAVAGATIATAVQTACQLGTPVTTIVVGTTTYRYGWNSVPAPIVSEPVATRCTVAPSTDGSDFTVAVKGDASADNATSTNGQQPVVPATPAP